MLDEQVVEKRVLQRQTKKQTTILFDQLCSKNQSKKQSTNGTIQREKIAKNLQQKNIEVLSITMWIHD